MKSWILTEGTEKIIAMQDGNLSIDEKVIVKAMSVIVGHTQNNNIYTIELPTSTIFYRRINTKHILFIISMKSIDIERIRPIYNEIILAGQSSEVNIESLSKYINTALENLKTKVLLMGFGGVGKTTIRSLIRDKTIPLVHDPTIGVEVIPLNEDTMLWDTAGQIGFLRLLPNYLKGSDLVIVVSDSTLENALRTKRLIEELRQHTHAEFVLVANKQDQPTSLNPARVAQIVGIDTFIGLTALDQHQRKKIIEFIEKEI